MQRKVFIGTQLISAKFIRVNPVNIPYNPVNTPPVYKPPAPRIYAAQTPQICNPINIPNISPAPRVYALRI